MKYCHFQIIIIEKNQSKKVRPDHPNPTIPPKVIRSNQHNQRLLYISNDSDKSDFHIFHAILNFKSELILTVGIFHQRWRLKSAEKLWEKISVFIKNRKVKPWKIDTVTIQKPQHRALEKHNVEQCLYKVSHSINKNSIEKR